MSRALWHSALVGLVASLVAAFLTWSVSETPRHDRLHEVSKGASLPSIFPAAQTDPAGGRCERTKRAVAHQSGARLVANAGAKLGAPRFALYRTGFRSAEPTVGITKSGTIFYEVVPPSSAGPGKPEVLRSRDGGETWENVSPQMMGIDTHHQTLDPFVYVDKRTSRIFNVDLSYP